MLSQLQLAYDAGFFFQDHGAQFRLGVVLSGVDGRRTRLAKALIDYVEKQFAIDDTRSARFDTTISRSTVIPEAQKEGKTLFQTAPAHKVCDQYRALAGEIENRLGKVSPQGVHQEGNLGGAPQAPN